MKEKLDKQSGVFEARNADGKTCLMVAIEYEDHLHDQMMQIFQTYAGWE